MASSREQGTSTTTTRDNTHRNKWYREAYTNRLNLELGNAEDGETPVVEAGRVGVVSLVSRRMVSATFSPTLFGGLPLPPCNRIEYSSSWRKNPIFGLTIPRFCLTAASASSGVILIVAMRYAHTMVALRLIPIKQWT
jgi:hypothetical protein